MQIAILNLGNYVTADSRDAHRPHLDALLGYMRDGDTVLVHRMDRLARNLDDLRRIVRGSPTGVRVESSRSGSLHRRGHPMATLLLSVMGAFAELERALPTANAKASPWPTTRRLPRSPQVPHRRPRSTAFGAVGEPKTLLAKEFGISRETVHQYLRNGPTEDSTR